jgi:hypothetical protein
MRSCKPLLLFPLLLSAFQSFSQDNPSVEMADTLRRDGKIYTVVISLVVVLTGVVIFLVRVDRKVNRLGKKDRHTSS